MCSMTWLYDAHIHLSDAEYEHDIPLILNCMKRLCIKACCVSMDYTSSKKTLELGKKSEYILPFIGMHPEKAQDDTESIFKLIVENNEKISGIGEIGLDHTYTNSDEEFLKQEEVFKLSFHTQKNLENQFQYILEKHLMRYSKYYHHITFLLLCYIGLMEAKSNYSRQWTWTAMFPLAQ